MVLKQQNDMRCRHRKYRKTCFRLSCKSLHDDKAIDVSWRRNLLYLTTAKQEMALLNITFAYHGDDCRSEDSHLIFMVFNTSKVF